MQPARADALIRPAVSGSGGTWADMGAGGGTFTAALARILGPGATVIAIERDPRALAALARMDAGDEGARIVVAAGDFQDPAAIPQLARQALDGVLFANALHYVEDPARVLRSLRSLLASDARVVVVEYDTARGNRWVPWPLPPARLRTTAEAAGLSAPDVVGRAPSLYHGAMYCAVMRADGTAATPPLQPANREQ